MNENIIFKAAGDHVRQWVALKRMYKAKRGFDIGQNRKAIPRTTNGDIAQLTKWWHGEYIRTILSTLWARDHDPASRKRWEGHRKKDRAASPRCGAQRAISRE